MEMQHQGKTSVGLIFRASPVPSTQLAAFEVSSMGLGRACSNEQNMAWVHHE